MSCITEETFGPTIPVIKVADENEAIKLANDSEYGLSASVWTGNKSRGQSIARRLTVGAVNINDATINLFNFALPTAVGDSPAPATDSAARTACASTAVSRQSRLRHCRRRSPNWSGTRTA